MKKEISKIKEEEECFTFSTLSGSFENQITKNNILYNDRTFFKVEDKFLVLLKSELKKKK